MLKRMEYHGKCGFEVEFHGNDAFQANIKEISPLKPTITQILLLKLDFYKIWPYLVPQIARNCMCRNEIAPIVILEKKKSFVECRTFSFPKNCFYVFKLQSPFMKNKNQNNQFCKFSFFALSLLFDPATNMIVIFLEIVQDS